VESVSPVRTLEKIGVKKDFMIENIDEQVKSVNMLLFIRRNNGEIVRLSRVVDEDEAFSTLYIPQIDTSIHGMNMGESFDGTLFKRFSFFLKEEEDFLLSSITNDFVGAGWSFYFNENVDFRVHN
jgi:hypothetical protein